MPGALAALYEECWNGVEFPTRCAVTTARTGDRVELDDVVEIVSRGGGREGLAVRLKNEHPARREHCEQHDFRLVDVLTEAMAFAWVVETGLGSPDFCLDAGRPDIEISGSTWVEVKSIHLSDAEWGVIRQGRSDGDGIPDRTGPMSQEPHPTLLKKINDAWLDGLCKFSRLEPPPPRRPIVWIQIRAFDWPLSEYAAWSRIIEWGGRATESGDAGLVLIAGWDWRTPKYASF